MAAVRASRPHPPLLAAEQGGIPFSTIGDNSCAPKNPADLTAAALAGVIASFPLTAPPAMAADLVAKERANVETIFARGSGQRTFDVEATRFLNQLRQACET